MSSFGNGIIFHPLIIICYLFENAFNLAILVDCNCDLSDALSISGLVPLDVVEVETSSTGSFIFGSSSIFFHHLYENETDSLCISPVEL